MCLTPLSTIFQLYRDGVKVLIVEPMTIVWYPIHLIFWIFSQIELFPVQLFYKIMSFSILKEQHLFMWYSPRIRYIVRGFEPRSSQTKDYNISICCYSAKHAAIRSKNTDLLVRNRDNVSEWSNISTHGLLFQ